MEENLKNYKEPIEDLREDDFDEYLDDFPKSSLYKIRSWGADPSVRELITMLTEKELIKPSLQRNYVWDKTMASRFIESILMGLPIPSIFLAETHDSKKMIIDGYQRVTTLYDYVETGKIHGEAKVFKLSNSKRLDERWRGKAFKELTDEEQRRIKSTTIHSIIFIQESPEDGNNSLFELFERINTGGKVLNNQEIRNCIYQGSLNDLLVELNDYPNWRILYGDEAPDNRMRDVELVLRFFAISEVFKSETEKNQISLKLYLNDYVETRSKIKPEDTNWYREQWKNTIDFIIGKFGENAFKNCDSEGKIIDRIHPTIFDSIAIATQYVLENKFKINESNNFNMLRMKLLSDENYKVYTTDKTTNVPNIKGRVNCVLRIVFGIK